MRGSRLKPAIVERFIAAGRIEDPLAVTVRSGNRLILVPTRGRGGGDGVDRRQYVGNAVVQGRSDAISGRGRHLNEASELKADLVDACENIRMGTALFAKVYRIVTKWYGNAVERHSRTPSMLWKTGYFEGKAVFTEPDPGEVPLAEPKTENTLSDKADNAEAEPSAPEFADPNNAGICVDLSGFEG